VGSNPTLSANGLPEKENVLKLAPQDVEATAASFPRWRRIAGQD
jgi:hypothetical protein